MLNSKRMFAALGAVLALAVGGGQATAQAGGAGKGKAPGVVMKAAASYVGLSPKELAVSLQSGRSLAQIATAQGKSVEGLKAAILAAFKARLDKAVAAGKATAAQAQERLSKLASRIDRLVSGAPQQRSGERQKGMRGHGVVLKAAAAYLGLDKKQLVTGLRSGQSLAQIATAQGKSVEGLKAAILAAFKARLDKAVAAGKATAAQAQERLSKLASRIDRLVSGAPKQRSGERQKGMRGHGVVLKAAAAYLGLGKAQLMTSLRSGSSLAQIATAQGKSVEGLKAAILAAFKAQLDRAVAANKLTAAQARSMLARFASHLDKIVNRSPKPRSK